MDEIKSTNEENETPVEIKQEMVQKKKKLPLGVKLLLLPFEIVLILLLIVLLWFGFCFFDRIKPVEALPPDYAVYMRTDSVWDTVEPLLDLDATLIAMTSPELQDYRDTFLEIKQSKLRKNFFVRTALKRRVDGAVYGYEEDGKLSAICVLDAGILSGAVRLVPYIIPHLNAAAENIEISMNSHGTFYQLGETGCFVIKKNLVVFSTSRALLEQAMTWSNADLYSSEEIAAFKQKLKEPLRILADGQNVLKLAAEMPMFRNYLEIIVPYLPEDEFTTVNFGITESDLNLTISVPVNLSEENEASVADTNQPVINLLKKDSKVPSLLPKFTDDVQYYTLISAGSLSELVEAIVKILPDPKKFLDTWNKSNTVSKIVFNTSLDELLFSWTGDEFAVFGIEGKAEPVFALSISDEAKRRQTFDRVFASFIVQSNDSLLVDGVRLPSMNMPSFMLSVLQELNINVPHPYYLIKDDYIFFSESPENLVAINADAKNTKKLSGSENWTKVSSKHSPYSTLSLYYNLERSVPFFIKGNSTMSKILSLYNAGRFDLKIKDNVLTVQLQASALELESSQHIPGFPIELENKSNSELIKSNAKKSKAVYWVETGVSVNSLDCGKFEKQSFELPEVQYIVAADEATIKANGGEIWAVTKTGVVYLLNSKLEVLNGYPVLSGVSMTCAPFVYKDSLVLTGNEGAMCFVSSNGEIKTIETGVESEIKATPTVNGDILAFYEKGFFGGIHIYKNLEPVTTEGPFEMEGIAYGSPCVFTAGGKQYTAMITQAGVLYVYDFAGNLLSPFPVTLPGVFFMNVEMADGYLFALSSEGALFRVGLDGKSIRVKIPYFTAKTGHITVCDYDGQTGQEIFVSGDGNSIYGFNSSMEMLPQFPVSGYGKPVFQDLNGDGKNDCLAITFDNKISAANVLR